MKKQGTYSTCDHCKTSFYRSPSNRNRTQNEYCSRKCMAEAFKGRKSARDTRVTVQCYSCGKDILRPQWHVKQTDKNFCNRKCFGDYKSKEWRGAENPCWRGGKLYYYGSDWGEIKLQIRQRDNFTCQCCGIEEGKLRRNLDIHHIVPFRLIKNESANLPSNLISLCPNCHTKAEHKCKTGKVKSIGELLSLIP